MSVVLYKKGEQPIYIDPTRLEAHLNAGWLLEDPEQVQIPSEEEKEPSNAQVRELARTAGIEGWDTLRIGTLKQKLSEWNPEPEKKASWDDH